MSTLTANPRSSSPSPSSAIYRDMWAVVFPYGYIVTGSELITEADAWRIALGWPGQKEIDDAIKLGAFAVKARLRYYSPTGELADRLRHNHDKHPNH